MEKIVFHEAGFIYCNLILFHNLAIIRKYRNVLIDITWQTCACGFKLIREKQCLLTMK